MAEAIKETLQATGLTGTSGPGAAVTPCWTGGELQHRCPAAPSAGRQKEIGKRRKDYMALTKLDAIAADKKLRGGLLRASWPGDRPGRKNREDMNRLSMAGPVFIFPNDWGFAPNSRQGVG